LGHLYFFGLVPFGAVAAAVSLRKKMVLVLLFAWYTRYTMGFECDTVC